MVSKVYLFGLLVIVTVVQANDAEKKLNSYTTTVATKLQEKVTKGALEADGLTQEKLENILKTTLASQKTTMHELKKLDKKSEKVPTMISNKLGTAMEKVMKGANMNEEEIVQNINSMKATVTSKVQEYQAAHV